MAENATSQWAEMAHPIFGYDESTALAASTLIVIVAFASIPYALRKDFE